MRVSDAAWAAGRFRDPGAAVHAAIRVLTCPFDTVIAELPDDGQVLDIGCGHGVFGVLARRDRPRLGVTGIDSDPRKIAAAVRAGERAFVVDSVGEDHRFTSAARGWSAVVIIDVLYLLGWEHADRLLADAATALGSGGVLVVKETGLSPKWKVRLSALQERVATSRLGPTVTANPPRPYPLDRGANVLAGHGLTVRLRAVDAGYHVPHRLLVARRSSSAGVTVERVGQLSVR